MSHLEHKASGCQVASLLLHRHSGLSVHPAGSCAWGADSGDEERRPPWTSWPLCTMACWWTPTNSKQIADALIRILTNSQVWDEMSQNGEHIFTAHGSLDAQRCLL